MTNYTKKSQNFQEPKKYTREVYENEGFNIPFEQLKDLDPEKDVADFTNWDSIRQDNFLRFKKTSSDLSPEDHVVEELNTKHAVVHTDCLNILTEKPHAFIEGIKDFVLESRQSLIHTYENQLVLCSDGKIRKKGQVWLAHPNRRSYDNGINFDPTTTQHKNGFYNLWGGFAFEPKKGCCTLFKNLMKEVICSGNEIYFSYLWKWCAYIIQHPNRIHTAILLMGSQGTGKGTFSQAIGKIFGKHFVHLDSVDRLIGNFNFHMKHAVLVYADEAIWGGNRKDVGRLKAMITEELAIIEAKGKDSITLRNFRHFIFSSNEEWPIHLDPDDRRVFVLKVSDCYKENHSYFKKIIDELDNNGYEALLEELLNEDVSDFNPRLMPTNLDAFSVKIESAPTTHKYIYEALKFGGFDIGNISPHPCWREEILTSSIYNDYLAWCVRQNIKQRCAKDIGTALSTCICSSEKNRSRAYSDSPSSEKNKRSYIYSLSSLPQARQDFQKAYKVGDEIWE